MTVDAVTQAYRFALDPTPAQRRQLASHVGAARFAFNRMLAQIRDPAQREAEREWFGEPVTPAQGWSLAALRRTWNAGKDRWAVNADTGEPWWPENSKEAYSSGLDALARALAGWSDSRAGKRAGRPGGFPRFRKRSRRMGVGFTTGAIRVESDRTHVTLPRIGRVKTHESTRKLARRVENDTARILVGHRVPPQGEAARDRYRC
ncbi:MAG: helix-turn-helix domain-containing protein [Egibacteraceae bacterium]